MPARVTVDRPAAKLINRMIVAIQVPSGERPRFAPVVNVSVQNDYDDGSSDIEALACYAGTPIATTIAQALDSIEAEMFPSEDGLEIDETLVDAFAAAAVEDEESMALLDSGSRARIIEKIPALGRAAAVADARPAPAPAVDGNGRPLDLGPVGPGNG